MLSLKPIYLWKYLGTRFHNVPLGVKRQFYISYEDALWHILAKKSIKQGSVVLVPEFFCGDVENNIKSHGYNIKHYKVSKLLVSSKTNLIKQIREQHPKVVIIFHPVGISNFLIKDKSWMQLLPPDSIVIEDCVHQIINSENIELMHPNHVIVDSLRKVLPLQGSVVYGHAKFLNFDEPQILQASSYRLRVTVLWFLMNCCWGMTQLFKHQKISVSLAKLANQLMIRGYNLIGDNVLPARGSIVFNFLQRFVEPTKVEQTKIKQVEYYEKYLPQNPSKNYVIPKYTEAEKGRLVAYPLIFNLKHAANALDTFHKHGIMLRFELNDSIWSRHHKILYLPLLPHLTIQDLKIIVKVAKDLPNY